MCARVPVHIALILCVCWEPSSNSQTSFKTALHNSECIECAADGSFLRSFLADSANMNPDERGHFLEEPPEGGPDIDKAHEVTLHPLQYC